MTPNARDIADPIDIAGEMDGSATAAPYESPTFTRLGTLSELTLGAGGGTDDGVGGFNDDGPGSV